jgi:hypothetical protein
MSLIGELSSNLFAVKAARHTQNSQKTPSDFQQFLTDFSNWGGISSQGTCGRRGRIAQALNRICSRLPANNSEGVTTCIPKRKDRRLPLLPILPSKTIRSPRLSGLWRKICRREIFRWLNRRSRRYRTIFSKLADSFRWVEWKIQHVSAVCHRNFDRDRLISRYVALLNETHPDSAVRLAIH